MSVAMLASPAALPEKAGMAKDETRDQPRDQAHRAIEAVFRIERARLIAVLARLTRDVDRAEELAQEALLIALTAWPPSRVPDNPGAWLTAAANRRVIVGPRHHAMPLRNNTVTTRPLRGARVITSAAL